MTTISSLRFIYILRRSGQLCGTPWARATNNVKNLRVKYVRHVENLDLRFCWNKTETFLVSVSYLILRFAIVQNKLKKKLTISMSVTLSFTIAAMPSLLCRLQILIWWELEKRIPTVVHTVPELSLWTKGIEWSHLWVGIVSLRFLYIFWGSDLLCGGGSSSQLQHLATVPLHNVCYRFFFCLFVETYFVQ